MFLLFCVPFCAVFLCFFFYCNLSTLVCIHSVSSDCCVVVICLSLSRSLLIDVSDLSFWYLYLLSAVFCFIPTTIPTLFFVSFVYNLLSATSSLPHYYLLPPFAFRLSPSLYTTATVCFLNLVIIICRLPPYNLSSISMLVPEFTCSLCRYY